MFVPDWSTWASFLAAIWLAPNGGLAVFWPAAVFLVLATGLLLAADLLRAGSWPTAALWLPLVPWLCVVLVLSALTAGLAGWASPLGHVAWGPRLILPWIPGCLFLLCFTYAGRLEMAMDWLRRHPALWLLVLGSLGLLSAPQVYVMFRPLTHDAWFYGPEPLPEFRKVVDIEGDLAYYYRTVNYYLWRRRWILAPAYDLRRAPASVGLSIFDALAIAVLLPLLASSRPDLNGSGVRTTRNGPP